MKKEEMGVRLKRARKKAGLTQSQVAEITGIAQVQLSYFETGKREPGISQLETLASLYGYQIQHFIEMEYEEMPEFSIAFRADQVSSEDFQVIEWAKRFVKNLDEMKRMKG